MTPFFRFSLPLTALLLSLSAFGPQARAQDNGSAGEPVVTSIDVAALTYDFLVDGTLAQDDPANRKFKTLQAAYAAAPAGTAENPMVIGLKPNVYRIDGAGAPASLTISKNYLTLLGLTNNRRSVVIADNRGNKQGGNETGSGNGYVVIVNAIGFTAKNLTFLNYCNVDYEYPGDPSKNLTKRSGVITQAVALQAQGDKHVYQNVALLSRLDTMFLQTTRSYFKDVYIEGTDDFIGGGTVTVWEDCQVILPEGSGVMAAGGVNFFRTRFTATRGLQFAKAPGRPPVLIDCVLPTHRPEAPVAWIRGRAPVRPNNYGLTYRVKDSAGNLAVVIDGSVGPDSRGYGRELSEREARAFNAWNLLRAPATGPADDWDPAGVRQKVEAADEGSLVFRMTLTGGSTSVRTGGPGAAISAAVLPVRAQNDAITWSTSSDLVSLNHTTGSEVIVTGKNSGEPAYVSVQATAANGFYATGWVFVEPAYLPAPKMTRGPEITRPAAGAVSASYQLDSPGRPDRSLVTWYLCDDANGGNPLEMAVSRGDEPMKRYRLSAGDVGKFLRVGVQPKHNVSDPGPAVFAVAAAPIVAADVATSVVSLNFRNFVTTPNPTYVSGRWTVLGTWTPVSGETLVDGFGLRVGSQGAMLFYQNDAKCGDMQVELTMSPEKTEGMGFGSPGGSEDGEKVQKADIFIKYDPRTRTGCSLRFWRTTQSTQKCMYQLFRLTNGVGTPLNDQRVFTGVFKPNTKLTMKVTGTLFSVQAENDVDGETLSLSGKIEPNDFGGAGVSWLGTVPRGNSNVYSRFEITYPGR